MKNGRFFTAIALSSIMLSSVIASPSASASEPKFILAGDSWPGYAPFWVAKKLGYFRGINFVFIKSETRDPLLLSGKVDAANLSMNQIIENYSKGYKAPIVIPMDYSDGADAIVSDKTIGNVAELCGHKIGLNTESYSELLLLGALSTVHKPLSCVRQINMQASSVPAALMSNDIKIGVTWQPNVGIAISRDKNLHVLFSSKNVPGLISDNIVFKRGFLKRHPKESKAVLEGYLQGLKYIHNHPNKSYVIMSSYMGVSPSEVKEIYSGVHNFTYAEMKSMVDGSAKMSYAVSIPYVISILKYQHDIPADYSAKWNEFVDPRLVESLP